LSPGRRTLRGRLYVDTAAATRSAAQTAIDRGDAWREAMPCARRRDGEREMPGAAA
jgi:hypothetical protein